MSHEFSQIDLNRYNITLSIPIVAPKYMKEEDVKELYKLIVDAVDSAFDTYPNVLHGDIVTRVDLLPKVT